MPSTHDGGMRCVDVVIIASVVRRYISSEKSWNFLSWWDIKCRITFIFLLFFLVFYYKIFLPFTKFRPSARSCLFQYFLLFFRRGRISNRLNGKFWKWKERKSKVRKIKSERHVISGNISFLVDFFSSLISTFLFFPINSVKYNSQQCEDSTKIWGSAQAFYRVHTRHSRPHTRQI